MPSMTSTTPCDFDRLARYFVSRCLAGEEKERLDKLKREIDDLRAKLRRFQHATDVGEVNTEDINEKSGVEEKKKVKERDDLLEDVYQRCLKAVLGVANSDQVKRLLKDFLKAKSKSDRYGPYVELCNESLKRLKALEGVPLRAPSELDVRFQVMDPKHVKPPSTVGTPSNLPRNYRPPNIACISSSVHELWGSPDSTYAPQNAEKLRWSQILTVGEFMASGNSKPTSDAYRAVSNPEFKFDVERKVAVLCEQIDDMDVPSQGEPMAPVSVTSSPTLCSETSVAATLKRSHMDDNSNTSNKRRRLSPTCSRDSQTSRSTTTESALSNEEESRSQKAVSGRAQLATHALEMLSYSSGVHHVIDILFVDEYLSLGYYDRQGIIWSDCISFVADFPRMLVLLLVFQRFDLEDWGIIPVLNPQAIHYHSPRVQPSQSTESSNSTPPSGQLELSVRSNFDDAYCEDTHLETISINTNEYLSNRPRCLAGRATAVFRATAEIGGNLVKLACKISNPEVQRYHEGETLRVVRAIAEAKDKNMMKHLPTLRFYGDLKRSGTCEIRDMIGCCWKGDRKLRIIICDELQELTTLKGVPFVKAWLETVTCHAFLWKHGIEHGDPSLYNVMFDDNRKCGVLTDFDLSVFQWLPRTPGTDPTGTVPFMAIDLLYEKYWNGKTPRLYHHELEAFIWILPFVFLLYDNQQCGSHPAVDAWITSDYQVCREKKADFYMPQRIKKHGKDVKDDFKACWPLAEELCYALLQAESNRHWHRFLPKGKVTHSNHGSSEASKAMWEMFINTLKRMEDEYPLATEIAQLERQKPGFSQVEHLDLAEICHIHKRVLNLQSDTISIVT